MDITFVRRRDQEHLDTKDMVEHVIRELLKVFPEGTKVEDEDMHRELVRVVDESAIIPQGAVVTRYGPSFLTPRFAIDLTECIFHI